MIRFALAVVVALCLSTVPLYAQSSSFTVTATSASIHQAPSAGSPVLAQRSEGAVLAVRSELAGWIEVAWPGAATGLAYVRATTGRIDTPEPARLATAAPRPMTIEEFVHGTPAASVPAAPGSPNRVATGAQRPMTIDEFMRATSDAKGSASGPAAGSLDPSAAYVSEAVAAVSAASTQRPNPTASTARYVAPPHFVGLGGRVGGSTGSIGATGRVWSGTRVGVQFELVRDASGNAAIADRVTSLQFAPSVLYALPNAVSEYFWVRPYVGGGATMSRSTLQSANSAEVGSSSNGSLGLQLFGGGEVTFSGVPRFALSADLGYRTMPTGLAGYEHRKIGLALSGHWFVR